MKAPCVTPIGYASDIEKIVYSNAYRRLANKSQIIIKPVRDHFRSRLIHTEEVNQIALSLGRALSLNLDLVTAIAKAHDLGHTPFGHAGERTVQVILEREISARFNVLFPKDEAEKQAFRKKLFHHSLNSARMLTKEREFEGISPQVINGVLTHSWSPWKKDTKLPIPETYEAQVVAVADQIASINHDTEDIIEGEPYTEYDQARFSGELIDGFRKSYPESYQKLKDQIVSLIVDKTIESGYGRQRRVNCFVAVITEDAQNLLAVDKHRILTPLGLPVAVPLKLPEEWSDFLRYYEVFIREIIQERASWFIARDNMAGALISTVFNHIWPRVRGASLVSQIIQPSLFKKEELVKSRFEEKTRYLEHFADFFNEHYIREKGKKENYYKEYLDKMKGVNFKVWDTNILESFVQEPGPDEFQMLTRLVAVIDFIGGLTDRYCLEMFNEVYQEFLVT